jgi:hypothetical protein
MTDDTRQQLKKMLEEAGLNRLQPMFDNFEELSRIVLSWPPGPLSGLSAPPSGFEFRERATYERFYRTIKAILSNDEGFTALLLLFGEVDPVWSYYLGQIIAEDSSNIPKAVGASLNTTWANNKMNIVLFSLCQGLKNKYREEFVNQYIKNLGQYQSLNLLGVCYSLPLFDSVDKEVVGPLSELLSMVEGDRFSFESNGKKAKKYLVKSIRDALKRIGGEEKTKSLKFWK